MAIAHCADELLKKPSSLIDHTFLKPQATSAEIFKLCEEAMEYHFFSVCVAPSWVPFAHQQVKNSNVKVCTVIGFPLGYSTSQIKSAEAQDAIHNGADELDMVINIGRVIEEQWDSVASDIQAVSKVKASAQLKVILETSYLTNYQIQKACEISVQAGADFVKTSTGFSSAGATKEHIEIMRKSVGPNFGVKASGGIRDWNDFKIMVEAGANRIGASSGVQILSGKKGEGY